MLEHKLEAQVPLPTPTDKIEVPTPSDLIDCANPTLANAQAWQIYLAALPPQQRLTEAQSALAQLSSSGEFDGVTREFTCTTAYGYRADDTLAIYGPARVYGVCEGFAYLKMGPIGDGLCLKMPSPYIEDVEDGLEQPVQTLLVPVFAIDTIIH